MATTGNFPFSYLRLAETGCGAYPPKYPLGVVLILPGGGGVKQPRREPPFTSTQCRG
jgi:hypothetical protein